MVVFPIVAIVTGFKVQLPFGGVATQKAVAAASSTTAVGAAITVVAVAVITFLGFRRIGRIHGARHGVTTTG